MENRPLHKEEKWTLPDFPIVDLGIIPILPSTLQIIPLGNLIFLFIGVINSVSRGGERNEMQRFLDNTSAK